MSKEDGAKIVVVGGKDGVGQQYCGTVGGQSTGFWTIDTEVKAGWLRHFLHMSLRRIPEYQTQEA